MHDDEVAIDEHVVRQLLAAQMPSLADRTLRVVEPWGTDNAIWRLGGDLVVRLPRYGGACDQVAFEATWLPHLALHVPIAIPEPIAVGVPGAGFPYPWAASNCRPDSSSRPVSAAKSSPTTTGRWNIDPAVDRTALGL